MVSLDIEDTITAIASPPGASQRGIVRISGLSSIECLAACFKPADDQSLTQLMSPDLIEGSLQLGPDLALPGKLLIWPTNQSYTRQPSAEFHTIGSPPLLQMVLTTLCQNNARIARPGEFTLRAFLSGRLDLTQAEAVLAVIDAKGESDLRLSLDQLAGGLATPLTSIRNDLIAILAELEAQLDFAEEDIEFISDRDLENRLVLAENCLQAIIDQISGRHVDEEIFTVVLTGLPNTGKSSLFNKLLGQSKAIVTNIAGTTTDYITGTIESDGLTIRLIDTAGLEVINQADESDWSVQSTAQQHRRERIDRANLLIHCVAANAPGSALVDLPGSGQTNSTKDIFVITKVDKPVEADIEAIFAGRDNTVIRTSSQNGVGIDQLRDRLFQVAANAQTSDSPIVASTVRRTADSLKSAEISVQLARQAASDGIGEELVAAEIRQALDDLGYVVGTIYTDDILDVVFGQFCIGK